MWSRLRTIELGAGHLEENQEYFPPLRIILCHGRHHEPKLLGKLQSPSPLHLVLDLKAQTSMAFLMPSPLLPTILLNQSQYTCCLTCLPFPSFSPSQGTSLPTWVPQSITQWYSHLFSNPLSLTFCHYNPNSPQPFTKSYWDFFLNIAWLGSLPSISTATLQFWATTMRLHACGSFQMAS